MRLVGLINIFYFQLQTACSILDIYISFINFMDNSQEISVASIGSNLQVGLASPMISNLSQNDKQRLYGLIQKDRVTALALAMSEIGASPNSEISDPQMKWMITHLCCRWNASNSLQYLLKLYFYHHPSEYLEFVNAQTADGSTCLHLCGIWKSEKCFYILQHYGGLNLQKKDDKKRTAYDIASEYNFYKIKDFLKPYTDFHTIFTQIYPERFSQGLPISEDSGTELRKKKRIAEERRNKETLKLTEIEKQLLQQKKNIERSIQKLSKQKLSHQIKAEAEKTKIAKQMKRVKISEPQRLEQQAQMKKSIDDNLSVLLQPIVQQLSSIQQELLSIKQSLTIEKQKREQLQKSSQLSIINEHINLPNFCQQVSQKLSQITAITLTFQQKLLAQQQAKQRSLKKITEKYNAKEEALKKKLKQKEQQIAKVRLQQQQKAKQQQLNKLITQIIVISEEYNYKRIIAEKQQQLRKINEIQMEKIRHQKEENLKREIQQIQRNNIAKQLEEVQPPIVIQKQKPKIEALSDIDQAFSKIGQNVPAEIRKKYNEALAIGVFNDKQFPADNSSIGPSSQGKTLQIAKNLVWLRPNNIFQGKFHLFDGIDANDIKQGSLGVCYLLATLSALAQNPKMIQRIFIFADTKVGFYILRYYIHGKPKLITIDDRIPCNKMTKSPLFTKPVGNQVWVMLIEKAWAKVIGNYLNAESMAAAYVMQDFTSAPGLGFHFETERSNAEHINKLINYCRQGYAIVLTSKSKKIDGIVANHAYTLLNSYQHKGRHIFKMRNPWANFQWNGQYNEKSKVWTEDLKASVGFEAADDGIFFITQNQLINCFCHYSINMIHSPFQYSHAQFTSKKHEQIFYKAKITQPGNYNFRVCQPFDRMINDRNYKYSPMVFEVGRITGDKVEFIAEGDNDTFFGAKSAHAFQDISHHLSPGEYFFRIRMYWVMPDKYNTAVLGSYGPQKIKFERLSCQQGYKYMKQLFISFGSATNGSQVGSIFYKIVVMKGQFLFITETDRQEKYKVTFQSTKSQMVLTEFELGRVADDKIEIITSKYQPGVGTAMRTDPAKGGNTGPVTILSQQI